MSVYLKICSAILSVLIIIIGIIGMLSGNENDFFLGVILILIGIFQYCLLCVISDTYDMVKSIKENNLPYIEDLITYTKNQVKEIKSKIEGEEENTEE